jgi:hypothetical protein
MSQLQRKRRHGHPRGHSGSIQEHSENTKEPSKNSDEHSGKIQEHLGNTRGFTPQRDFRTELLHDVSYAPLE